MKFQNEYSYLAWEMFKMSGNPYLMQECILEEKRLREDSLGKGL